MSYISLGEDLDIVSFLRAYSRIFVVVDENTRVHCLPLIKSLMPSGYEVIEIKAGEQYKNIDTVASVWSVLTEHGADRDACLVNLGGGVVCDLGGFAASCYKRGVDFVNVPTTLLAMVDASVGGKTGVDFKGLKNHIGVFTHPKGVWINDAFLSTLPMRELRAGLAEIKKYGYVSNPNFLNVADDNYRDYLVEAARLKMRIVEHDFRDRGMRKILNFGHTIGHALESVSLTTSAPLLHGEAVALGIYGALYLSERLLGLSSSSRDDYRLWYERMFADLATYGSCYDKAMLKKTILHDKKNKGGSPSFVLLSDIGVPMVDCCVDEAVLDDAIEAINLLLSS